jgi:NADH-quinone oxidoreductase subunit H
MLIGSLEGIMGNGLSSHNPLVMLLFVVIYAVGVLIIMSAFAYVFGWIERKIIAKIQLRHGPNQVGKYGILQNLADIVKLISKEKAVPSNADRSLFILAPQLMLSLMVFLILLVPIFPSLQVANFGLSMLAIFVLLGFSPLILFVIAFSSGNKFADLSAQRSVLMLMSYEIPMIITVASVFLVSNSYNIQSIVAMQSKTWFAIMLPIGFIVFFIAMLAELERPPFDLMEADSELIAGWLTDVSAPYYAIALFIDYTRMFLGGLLISILFLGGWNGPILPPTVWLIVKAFVIAIFIIIIRASTVRMRIDRVLRLGWVWLIPLALINLVMAYVLFG